MSYRKRTLTASPFLLLLLLIFAFGAPTRADAKIGGEYKAIVGHLKTKYRAQKVKIPFLWLARFAVRVVRPAGVKSFSVTMFQNLQFAPESLDREMQGAMRNSLGAEWSPILRVRSRDGQQAYMYMRESGDAVKLMVVTIDKNQAAVIRAKFSPEKLAEFVNDPKIFGISLNDGENKAAKNAAGDAEKRTETAENPSKLNR